MQPVARYIFQQSERYPTRFILLSHEGQEIENFPAIYQIGVDKGKRYIGFRKTVSLPKAGHRSFEYTIELAKGKVCTGVNFTSEYPNLTYGDNKSTGDNHGILIRFSENGTKIEMLFYKDMANNAQTLFEKWIAGTVSEVVNPLPATTMAF
ncbi:MAG: hypothetical protein ACRCZB_06950 [Bacteroidales bacterium]